MGKNVINAYRKQGLLLLLCVALFAVAKAQLSAGQKVTFQVQQGWKLDKTLMELSRVSGVNIAFNPAALQQVAAPAQTFQQAPLQAILNRLLSATPFTWQLQHSRLVIYRKPAAAQQAQTAPTITMAPVLALPVVRSALITGLVRTEEGRVLPAATIRLPQLNQYYTTDAKGFFNITVTDWQWQQAVAIEVFYIGYQKLAFEISTLRGDTVLPDVVLKEMSLRLKDISVTANRNFTGSSNSSLLITREVIEQTTALSLNDLLNQIPNRQITPPSLQNVQNLSLRASFAPTTNGRGDFLLNNAFGVGIVLDGNVVSNNMNMQSYNPGLDGLSGTKTWMGSGNSYGLTSSGTRSYSGDFTFGGTDLRQIPPDNIESIEVVAGVASAKYGDISDGVVLIERQAGISKGYVRMQLRDNATSYSFTRGSRLSAKAGVLNTSISYVNAYDDARDKLKAYRRLTGNLIWTNYIGRAQRFKYTTILDYGRNLDGIKKDPDNPASTSVKFNSWNFTVSQKMAYRVNGRFLKNISLNLRYSEGHQYSETIEEVNRAYIMYTTGITTGIHDGNYAGGVYTAASIIDGRPVNAAASIDINNEYRLGRVVHYLTLGGSYNYGRNKGLGQVSDANMPREYVYTKPSLSISKAERNYDFSRVVPQQDVGVYIEDVSKMRIAGRFFNLRAGVRMDVQNGFITASPRINMNYELSSRLRVGLAYGRAYKSPGLAQRYPGPVFLEVPVLNAYTGKAVESKSLIYVHRHDPSNKNLHSSASQTLEASAQYRHGGFSVSANLYSKWAWNGITTADQKVPVTLPQYEAQYREGQQPLVTQTGTRSYLLEFYIFQNLLKSNSQGLELMVGTPAVKAIATSFTAAMGFTRTHYNSVRPYWSSTQEETGTNTNPLHAKMGLYPPRVRTSYFSNGRITAVTHIPRVSLVLQFIAECNFLNKTHISSEQGIPIAYYNNALEYIPIDKFEVSNPYYGRLYKPVSELNESNINRMIMNFHLSIGKEIRKRFRIAFNVYNVFNYQPWYTTPSGIRMYPNAAPTFGAELSFKL